MLALLPMQILNLRVITTASRTRQTVICSDFTQVYLHSEYYVPLDTNVFFSRGKLALLFSSYLILRPIGLL